MKANELMIGDWVRFEHSDLCHKVYGVQGKSAKVDKQYWYKADKLHPVPLTAEILINNGFEHNETTYWGERYSLVYQRNGVNYNEIFELVPSYGELHEELDYMWFPASSAIPALLIKNVHELQHAMRLCGIEKEVVL